jgi:hypothetical protein
METRFKDMMDPDEDQSFIRFSKSMPDLAQVFRIVKQDKTGDANIDLMRRKTFKKNQHEASKMIFGVG